MFKTLRNWLFVNEHWQNGYWEMLGRLGPAEDRAAYLEKQLAHEGAINRELSDKLAACEAGHLELQAKLAAAEEKIAAMRRWLDSPSLTETPNAKPDGYTTFPPDPVGARSWLHGSEPESQPAIDSGADVGVPDERRTDVRASDANPSYGV